MNLIAFHVLLVINRDLDTSLFWNLHCHGTEKCILPDIGVVVIYFAFVRAMYSPLSLFFLAEIRTFDNEFLQSHNWVIKNDVLISFNEQLKFKLQLKSNVAIMPVLFLRCVKQSIKKSLIKCY